jgi:hypothetical protein
MCAVASDTIQTSSDKGKHHNRSRYSVEELAMVETEKSEKLFLKSETT